MRSTFDVAKGEYENKVNNWVNDIPLSRERLALVSLAYNTRDGSSSLLGAKLKTAIEEGNRADAWYEIRYQSNKGALGTNPPSDAGGIAKRRYYESDIFGLSDHDRNITAEEWSLIENTYIKNAEYIKQYDTKYGTQIAAAERDYKADINTTEEAAFAALKQFYDGVEKAKVALTMLISGWLKTTADMMTAARTEASPLILDLDGDGIEVSALNSTGSVYWDVDNDGFREASSWVGKDDGLLALDINKNGIIDNHSELFGTLKTDGFTVLTGLDSNQNGMIDAGDTRFNDLRVWVDANNDGISQAAELKTLAQAGVQSISLNDTTTNQTINGNKVTHISTFTKTNGTTGTIADVWFNYDNVNSRADNTTPINPLTLFLPNLRGFGRLADLSIAMSKDAALLSKVQALTNAPLDTLFAPSFDLMGKMRDMLFTWAGVSGVAVNGVANDNFNTFLNKNLAIQNAA